MVNFGKSDKRRLNSACKSKIMPKENASATPLRVLPFIGLLTVYRVVISPVLHAFGVRCRHDPSCSAYGMTAFQRHGIWRGFWLTGSRLSRCHPWGSYGFDPVPVKRTRGGWRFWQHGDWSWTPRDGSSNLDRTTDNNE